MDETENKSGTLTSEVESWSQELREGLRAHTDALRAAAVGTGHFDETASELGSMWMAIEARLVTLAATTGFHGNRRETDSSGPDALEECPECGVYLGDEHGDEPPPVDSCSYSVRLVEKGIPVDVPAEGPMDAIFVAHDIMRKLTAPGEESVVQTVLVMCTDERPQPMQKWVRRGPCRFDKEASTWLPV